MITWSWIMIMLIKHVCTFFVCNAYNNRSTWLILVMPNVIGTQIAESISPSRNTENLDWMLVIQNISRLVPFVGQSAGEKLNEVITMHPLSNLCFCSNLSFAWLNLLGRCTLILFSLCFSFLILKIVLYNFSCYSSRLVFYMEASKVSFFVLKKRKEGEKITSFYFFFYI